MIRAVGERDFSSQETAHMVLSLPLTSCSFSFITLSLTGSRKLSRNKDSGELEVKNSFLDHYASCNIELDMSLLQFASEYSLFKGAVRKRSSHVIVRTIPNYSSNPSSENYGLYCKFQLVKHKPWHGNLSNAWGGSECTTEICIAAYHSFLQTHCTQDSTSHFHHDLLLARSATLIR